MKFNHKIGLVLSIFMPLMSIGFEVFALDSEESRATLQGLDRVSVVVETLDPEIKQEGLTETQIQREVEQGLKQVGIELLTGEKWQDEEQRPCVYVRPNVYKPWPGFYFCCIDISLVQDVALKRNSRISVHSPTWSMGKFGVTHSIMGIRESIKDCVDRFITAYQSVNPKHEQARPIPKNRSETR
jgi:hypothetical protein